MRTLLVHKAKLGFVNCTYCNHDFKCDEKLMRTEDAYITCPKCKRQDESIEFLPATVGDEIMLPAGEMWIKLKGEENKAEKLPVFYADDDYVIVAKFMGYPTLFKKGSFCIVEGEYEYVVTPEKLNEKRLVPISSKLVNK